LGKGEGGFFFGGCGRALFKSAFESARCWEGKQRLGWGFVGTWRGDAGSDEFGWVEMAKCLRVGRLDFFERGKGGVGECIGNGVGGEEELQ